MQKYCWIRPGSVMRIDLAFRLIDRTAHRVGVDPGLERAKHSGGFPIIVDLVEFTGRPGKFAQIVVEDVFVFAHRNHRDALFQRRERRQGWDFYTARDEADENPTVGYARVDHDRYQWIIDMRAWLKAQRRG